MAERASLMRKNGIVNQSAAFILILFSAACGGKDEPPKAAPSTDLLSAPIIWQTGALKGNLSALAMADDGAPRFLTAFEAGGLQLINFDGGEVSQPGPYTSASLGSGARANFQGAELVVFPGIARSGDQIVAYVYGEGLMAPFEIALEGDIAGAIEGMCAAPANYDAAIANIAYWTDIDDTTLVRGRIRAEGENLVYEEIDELQFPKYLTACDLTDDKVVAGGGFGLEIRNRENNLTSIGLPDVPVDVTAVSEGSDLQIAAALSGGRVFVANETGPAVEVDFEASLSSQAPEKVAHVILSKITGEASFPNGFLAVESRVAGADTQLVFVDRQDLFSRLQTGE